MEVKTRRPNDVELSHISESQLIQLYKGKLIDGVVYAPNYFYIPLRVTGCGETLRYEEGEGVFLEDRSKADFFKKEFVEQCGRLPITIGHPKDSVLSNDTIKEAEIVGQTIGAWIEGDEIWALGRIYDKSVLPRLGKDLKSTSPGVVSNSSYHSEGLNEGIYVERPLEFNHLAFVEIGHWDQKSKIAFRLDAEKKEVEMIAEQNNPSSVESQAVAPIANEPSVTADAEAKDGGESLAEVKAEVEKLKEHEKAEEPAFEKLAEQHKQIDEEVKMADAEKIKADEAEEKKVDEEVEVKADEETEIVDEEEVEIIDEGEEEIVDEGEDEVIVADSGDEKVDEEEVILDEEETRLDAERGEIISILRKVCDSAHPSLNVKMPYITERETARSVILKFAKMNTSMVEDKYKNLLSARLDATSADLSKDILDSMAKRIEAKSAALGKTKGATGWVDSGAGYSINADWLKRY